MKNIIFTVSALHGGGAERVCALLATEYARQGHRVTILMIAGDECLYELPESVRLLSIAGESGGNPITKIKRILRLRAFYKKSCREYPDTRVIALSTNINMQAIIAHYGIGGNLTVSERNDPDRYSHKSLRDAIYRLGAGAGVSFVFQTPDAMKAFEKYPRITERSRVVPNPIKPGLPKASPTPGVISACGRLEDQKNYPLMLRAFALFHRKYPDYRLDIYGDGSRLDELKRLASDLGIDRSVIFCGFLRDVNERVARSEMFIMSSAYEGMPNALMEAMAMGLPCISTDCPIGGPGLLIDSGENGILVPMNAGPKALAEAMGTLAKDAALRRRLGEKAAAIGEKYNIERIAGEFIG